MANSIANGKSPTFDYYFLFSISPIFLIFECKILLFHLFWPLLLLEPCEGHRCISFLHLQPLPGWNRNSKFWISLAYQIVTFVLCFSYSGLSVVGVVWMEQLQRGLWKRNKNQSQVNTAIHSRSIKKWTSLFSPKMSNSFNLGKLYLLFFLVLTSKTSCRIKLCSHLTFALASASTSPSSLTLCQWRCKHKRTEWVWTHSLRQC